MARPSARKSRTEALLALTDGGGRVRLRDAARRLGVTEMTLRRDAAQPDAPLRCLGGWLVAAGGSGDYDLTAEMLRHVEAKNRAARHVAAGIPTGARVFVDCGTTTPHLARLLPEGVIVVTHSLAVAQAVAARGGLGLELLGGAYHPESGSLHTDPPLPEGMAFDIAVLSAGGIGEGPDGALSCSHRHERAIKRAALARAGRRVVLADDSKLGQRRPVAFARRAEVDAVVTERGPLEGGSWPGAGEDAPLSDRAS